MGVVLHTSERLTSEIERLVRDDGVTYLDALRIYMDSHSLEPESMAQLIDGPLKEKLRVESYNLNMLGRKFPKLNFLTEEE